MSRQSHNMRLPGPNRAECQSFATTIFADEERFAALAEGGQALGHLRGMAIAARSPTLLAGNGPVTLAHIRTAFRMMGGQGMSAAQVNQDPGAQFVRVANPMPETLALTLTEAEYPHLENGIDGTQELIRDAGETFDYLAMALSSGYLDREDAALAVILRMSARAMKAGSAREIDALELLDMKLRIARLRANGGVVK